MQDKKIFLQPPTREKPKTPGVSYDGLEDTKKVDLTQPSQDPKTVWIATYLAPEEELMLISALKEYKDVFAWSYKDFQGIDPKNCQHTILMLEDAKPLRQCPYTYNDNFSRKINKEINNILKDEFIYEIEHIEWVSPIVIIPKK